MSSITRVDDPDGLLRVAAQLPDTPETVIALHLLRRGLCRAYVAGSIGQPEAIVIDTDEVPGEPGCYGDDPAAIWSALQEVPNWFAANMREAVAPNVSAMVEREWRETVSYLGDLHFTLQQPAPEFATTAVRLLGPDDLALLMAAPALVQGGGFGNPVAMLADGIVAAAVVDGAIIAIAHTSAITEQYADIGVATLPEYRGRGFATSTASLVARGIQQHGRTPVWSCGETNAASLGVARRLGFEPVLRRVYVILESRRRTHS